MRGGSWHTMVMEPLFSEFVMNTLQTQPWLVIT